MLVTKGKSRDPRKCWFRPRMVGSLYTGWSPMIPFLVCMPLCNPIPSSMGWRYNTVKCQDVISEISVASVWLTFSHSLAFLLWGKPAPMSSCPVGRPVWQGTNLSSQQPTWGSWSSGPQGTEACNSLVSKLGSGPSEVRRQPVSEVGSWSPHPSWPSLWCSTLASTLIGGCGRPWARCPQLSCAQFLPHKNCEMIKHFPGKPLHFGVTCCAVIDTPRYKFLGYFQPCGNLML